MGGAIFSAGDMTIENAVFHDNKAVAGSAIWCEGNLTDTNSRYYNNHAIAAGTLVHKQQIGKALSTMTLNNPEITNNIADQSCGGIYDSGCVVVNDGSISDNKVTGAGGAVYCEPLANPSVVPKLYLNRVLVSNNTASTDGGAIYCGDYLTGNLILELYNSHIIGNKAGGNGGAIYSTGKVVIKDTSNDIRKNEAGINGGGVYVGSQGRLNIFNTQVLKNTAKKGRGGGIYLAKGVAISQTDAIIKLNTPDNTYQAKS